MAGFCCAHAGNDSASRKNHPAILYMERYNLFFTSTPVCGNLPITPNNSKNNIPNCVLSLSKAPVFSDHYAGKLQRKTLNIIGQAVVAPMQGFYITGFQLCDIVGFLS
jgi:hypothetical protein